MIQPKSKAYRFDRLMAENDMCQSWWATRIASGRKCFIKTISPTNMLNVSALKEILSDSFACQKGAYSYKVLWARRKRLEAGNLFVEYPYLDTEVWRELTPEDFRADFSSILLQICIVIDYLHLLDLVHCDLKLSNFLVNSVNGSRSVILVDLDFLCKTDSRPKAKILGTPEHIAPEIRANDRITTQSDNYSLGVSLAKLIEHLESRARSADESAAVDIEKLRAFTAQLTQDDPVRRPRSLVEGLRQYGLIDEPAYESAQKSVLAMGLLTGFCRERRKLAGAGSSLKSFFQRNRVLGLREELIIDFNAAYSNRPLETLKAFKFLFQKAEISRLGDYWHFSADDDTLQKTYSRLERIIASGPGPSRLVSSPERVDIDRLVAEAGDDEKSEHFQKAYLRLKTALTALEDHPEEDGSEKREQIYRKLAYLATVLNRVSRAAEYYEKVREIVERQNRFDPELLYELVLRYNSMADYDRGSTLVERALADERLKETPRYYLQMKRSQAFDAGLRGRLEEAAATIEETLEEAIEIGDHEVETMATYTRAILSLWQGDKPAAVRHLQNGLKGARTTDSRLSVMLITNLLAMIYHERTEFRKAIEYAKMSEENAVSPLAALRLPAVFYTLSAAHMREGEYRKAEYWLQRVFNLKSVDVDRSALISHYCYDAFLKANSGNLEQARSSCVQALQLLRSAHSSAYQGKAYHNLAEIALYRGKMDECTSALNSAAAVFEEIGDKSSLAEIATIRAIQEVYYSSGPVDASPLLRRIEELLKYDCRMYAVLTALYVLLSSDETASKGAIKLIGPFLDPYAKTNSPVLRSLLNLVNLVRSGDNSPNAQIRTFKEIHSILVEGEQKFLGMLSAYRIGQLYLLGSRIKFARKFFLRARTLAEALSNDSFQAKINDELKLTLASAEGESQLVHSIHVISEIFQNIDRYADSLKAMVRFAVEATGAERGALLLKKEQSGKLQVVAYENCDEDSLDDIESISSSIPLRVSSELEPLVIENALNDKRTNRFKSIIHHNILSVICLPIAADGSVMGALYLDHHTIPALFDDQDVKYINSIANFLSVMLSTIQRYKSMTLINQQLIEDINQLGGSAMFVADDEVTKALLSMLPEIARSNASVLIRGESGTGKEILADMIHRLSHRREMPLVKVNCSAIPENLVESELFGVANRAVTGVEGRDGKLAAADGGTLLLDEIGDMSTETQAKVLRVLETREFQKVGSNRTTYSDVRFIYATNKDLGEMVKEGRFREDLYYRINTFDIEIPPLRERRSDIIPLLQHFVAIFSAGRAAPRFAGEVIQALLAYDWPGNVRELRNFVERCCITGAGRMITREMLPPEMRDVVSSSETSKKAALEAERAEIHSALIQHRWNQSRAARFLGLPLTTLRRKMKKHNITKPR